MESVFMTDLSWAAFAQRMVERSLVFIPVGATEQHGRHLPLGVDAIIPTSICAEAARRCGGLVASVLAHGNRSQSLSGEFLNHLNQM